MDLDTAARRLAELGNATRLEIVRLLVRAGPEGLAIGEIQSRLGTPASTLAFHLRGLVTAGLVVQVRDGRTVRCTPRFDVLNQTLASSKSIAAPGSMNSPRGRFRRPNDGAGAEWERPEAFYFHKQARRNVNCRPPKPPSLTPQAHRRRPGHLRQNLAGKRAPCSAN